MSSSFHDDDDDGAAMLSEAEYEDQDHDEEQEDQDQEEDQEEEEEEEEGHGAVKVDIPQKCMSATGKLVDVPANVQAAIRTRLEVKPELDAITKACGQVRKKVTAAKKEMEKFMTANQVDVLVFGANKYVRVRKERVKINPDSVKKSKVLTEGQKKRLLEENTKPAVSFKEE